jgi:hypothetical protein
MRSRIEEWAASARPEMLAPAWEQPTRRRVRWDFALLGGFAFKSGEFLHEPEGGIRLLRGTNLGAGFLRWDDTVYWPASRLGGIAEFALREGDLVLGLNRSLDHWGAACGRGDPRRFACALAPACRVRATAARGRDDRRPVPADDVSERGHQRR